MSSRKRNGEMHMQLDVPEQLMKEIAEIIENSDLDATILGVGDEVETIAIRFEYSSDNRDEMMEILELVEDYSDNEE